MKVSHFIKNLFPSSVPVTSTVELYKMATSHTSVPPSSDNSPAFPFNLHESVDAYKHPYKTYLQKQPFFEVTDPRPKKVAISWVVVGALTFHPTSDPPRILLIQRSASDTMPHRWEIPGGGCDESDESILHGVARELKEEAGLVPHTIGPLVGQGYVFELGKNRFTRKLNFIVEIDAPSVGSDGDEVDVKLDPDEHEAFIWASEKEVREGKVGDLNLIFTSQPQRDVLLEAFDIRKRDKDQTETGEDMQILSEA